MGWLADEYGTDHEGYAVAVLGTGAEPDQEPVGHGEGTSARRSSWWLYDGREGRPRAVAVRAACACGWRSADMFPIDVEDQEGTEGFRSGEGPFGAWNGHVHRLAGGTVPQELVDAIATVRRMLTGLAVTRPAAAVAAAADVERLGTALLKQAVTSAREDGRSWEAIGRDLGVTRQSAHQRFAGKPLKG